MSQNHWETQPRLSNGEFTYRYEFWKRKLKAMEEADENPEVGKKYEGGSYNELKKKYKGNPSIEIHHTPADSVSPLSKWRGPCIAINKEDHKKTGSYKNYKESVQYRSIQKKLIENGKFMDAEIMDFEDLVEIGNCKYVKAMLEKLEYDKELFDKGVING